MFGIYGQTAAMIVVEPSRPAELVASIHSPWRASVAECVLRWTSFDDRTRAQSYFVVRGDEPGARHTFNGDRIAELAE